MYNLTKEKINDIIIIYKREKELIKNGKNKLCKYEIKSK